MKLKGIFNFKKVIKFFERIYWVLLIFVLIISVLTLFSTFYLPWNGFPRWLVVYSGSMSPAIPTGSLILIKQEPSYRQGETISYITEKELGLREPKFIVTHRIVEQKENKGKVEYVTKGDVNNATDSALVKQGLILGKVLISIPLLGFIVGFAKTLPGLIILVVIPATIIVYSEILNFKRIILNKRKRKNEK